MKRRLYVLIATISIVGFAAADWPRFRGPNGSGVASDAKLPLNWSLDGRQNLAWQAELPGRGSSCPIVVGDRVIITATSGYRSDRLHVNCYDVNSGEVVWERQLWATGRTMTHPSISPAAPTPVSDGERVFVYFSSNDVACFNLAGDLHWVRGLMIDFPNASNSLGLASSPLVAGGALIVPIENDSQSVAVGLAAETGETLWAIDRPEQSCWTSPVAMEDGQGNTLVLLQSTTGATAYNPKTGEEVWHYDQGCSSQPSTVTVGDIAYVPSNGLVALRSTASSTPEVLWSNNRLETSTPTPLVYEGRIYALRGAILKCADAQTGKLAWQLRLKGGRFSGSPVAAGGHIYVINDDGLGQVIQPDDKRGEVVGGGDLGETILATPAIAGDAMYVRSDKHLWKIASGPAAD